ncbi:HlyD family secretion protein [Photobacterium sanctipauli]|uniref:HlyD family secretion protein n=1 Tax=Photobacterium sanctipauli TaxID=1342794 RepID=A0A2T3NPQ8_9GAMM|nr:HlyD family secretion protein [Photobacterium sanctipauli]PSW18202.1 HlyD family secretion protein [Photobacterium sanctipauli]
MNADKQFKLWMRTLIVLFIVLFAYVITADRHAPFTTEGRVQGYVVQIAPEVSGKITQVLVENNQRVSMGEPLFIIDDRKYQIALEKAQLSLQSAFEQEATLYSKKEAALANISRASANYEHANKEFKRLKTLSDREVISHSKLDDAIAQVRITKATLRAEKQNLKVIESQLGDAVGQSTPVLAAKNQVERAELDLANTVVVAPSNGVVTNLQLEEGTIANANAPLLTFVPSGSLWLTADFREKSVAAVTHDYAAWVTFDAYPGEIYTFNLNSRDFGVATAQQQPNGLLTQVESNNRWVRDAQRTRINLTSEASMPSALFVGSRATVVIFPEKSVFWTTMAKIQIKLASWLHFIY